MSVIQDRIDAMSGFTDAAYHSLGVLRAPGYSVDNRIAAFIEGLATLREAELIYNLYPENPVVSNNQYSALMLRDNMYVAFDELSRIQGHTDPHNSHLAQAEKFYRAAHKLKPKLGRPFYKLVRVKITLANHEGDRNILEKLLGEAENLTEKAHRDIGLRPEAYCAKGNVRLAQIRISSGKEQACLKKARMAFKKAEALSPKVESKIERLCFLYFGQPWLPIRYEASAYAFRSVPAAFTNTPIKPAQG